MSRLKNMLHSEADRVALYAGERAALWYCITIPGASNAHANLMAVGTRELQCMVAVLPGSTLWENTAGRWQPVAGVLA